MTEQTLTDPRMTLTRASMHVLDSWNLSTQEICDILGLPAETRLRSLQKYRSHQPFPVDSGLDRRVDYLLRIAGALRTSYPANPQMGLRWLRQRHRRLGCSPIAAMCQEGESGLVLVLAELDACFCWDLSGSTRH